MQEKQLIADSCRLIGKIEGRWTTAPLGRGEMEARTIFHHRWIPMDADKADKN
jgi:hypothetical protein